jgi:zinc transport system substrate-binding protein
MTQKPVVTVSNYPLQYMVARIGFPVLEVRFPASGSDDPAYWRPTAEEVAMLQNADLIVLNGASYEHWLKGVSLPLSRVVETAASFQERWITVAGAVTHSHGPEGKHEHGEIAFTTWLDLSLAVEQARAIGNALSARWPEQASLFQDNAAKLERELRDLDSTLLAIGRRAGPLPVIFSHPVYQYLERRYGIKGESVHWEPGEVPAEERWTEMGALKKRTQATVVVWESEPLLEVRERLRTMGLGSVVVNPCGTVPVAGDFLSIMRDNANALDSVLAR